MPKRKIKLAASDGKRVGSNKRVSTPKKPQGGASFQTYSLRSNLAAADFAPNWKAFFIRPGRSQTQADPRRRQRQDGKILEAQKFRKYQGVFLATRLHALAFADKQTGLSWWFQTHPRLWLHHTIMSIYYLDDAPTLEQEILRNAPTSNKTMRTILQTAVEIGSLDRDVVQGDRRRRCYYPTRGLVSDTDAFFHSHEPDAIGTFTIMRQLLDRYFGQDKFRLSDYECEVANFYTLMDQMMERSQTDE